MKKRCLSIATCFVGCLMFCAQAQDEPCPVSLGAWDVTPESFGCAGDGVTDDTENLQKAIDFCKKNSRLLRSSKGKAYAISKPLDLKNPGEMQIDFGGAEIKATRKMDFMINYDNSEDFSVKHNNIINNLSLDCNHLSGGIHCPEAVKTHFNFIMVRNCPGKAFEALAGYEIFFTNSHIHCDSDKDSYGIYTKTGDSHFDNIVIIDAHTAVYQDCRPVNFYDKIHAWLFSHVEGSVFFCIAGGLAMLNQCYCDTAEKGYYMPRFATLKIVNSQYYNNPECYDSPNNPVVFAFGDENVARTANVGCIGSCFNSGGLNVDLCNVPTQRIQFDQCFMDPSIKGNPSRFGIEPADGVSFNFAGGEVLDGNVYFLCPDKDKRNHLYVDACLLRGSENGLIKIGAVPKEYLPAMDAYGLCVVVGEDGDFSQGTVRISHENGGIWVRHGLPKKKAVKRIVIEINYNN